jgi:hypothetical protein
MSRSKSRSSRKLNAYTRFTKANLPACHREAVKKFGEGKRANKEAMRACAAKYRRSHSKSRSRK